MNFLSRVEERDETLIETRVGPKQGDLTGWLPRETSEKRRGSFLAFAFRRGRGRGPIESAIEEWINLPWQKNMQSTPTVDQFGLAETAKPTVAPTAKLGQYAKKGAAWQMIRRGSRFEFSSSQVLSGTQGRKSAAWQSRSQAKSGQSTERSSCFCGCLSFPPPCFFVVLLFCFPFF